MNYYHCQKYRHQVNLKKKKNLNKLIKKQLSPNSTLPHLIRSFPLYETLNKFPLDSEVH